MRYLNILTIKVKPISGKINTLKISNKLSIAEFISFALSQPLLQLSPLNFLFPLLPQNSNSSPPPKWGGHHGLRYFENLWAPYNSRAFRRAETSLSYEWNYISPREKGKNTPKRRVIPPKKNICNKNSINLWVPRIL